MSGRRSLPVRLEPVQGEALASLVARTAQANDLSVGDLVGRGTHRWRLPTRPAIASVTEWSHLDVAEVTQMTLRAYTHGVRGRADRRRPRTWRVDGAVWVCPVCTPSSGAWLRDWALACHPLCLGCSSLLVDRRDLNSRPTVLHPDRSALDVQRRISRGLTLARTNGRASIAWRSTYRLATLASLTADESWPRLPAWEAETRAGLGALYRKWHVRPPKNPAQAASIVFEAWRAVESPERGRRLIAEGWERVLAHPDPTVRAVADTPGVLPVRPQRVRLPNRDSSAADAVLAHVIRTVRRLQMQDGLEAGHVPAWCVTGDEIAPAESDWVERAHLAVILHIVCSGGWHTHWTGERRAKTALRLGQMPPNLPLALLRDGRALASEYGDLLVACATNLADRDLVDYDRRRAALWPMVHHARLPHGAATGALPEEVPDGCLADWLWIHLTGGPVPGRPGRTRDAIVLNDRIDPETRLHLVQSALDDIDAFDPAVVTPLADAGVGELESEGWQ
ncbi:TniQ family protein [Cellulomonas humilata]|uniref:TniQ family protein n=1 Tax=Cellulomonas humilata TaxID=144055 RepID=UPI0031B5A85C